MSTRSTILLWLISLIAGGYLVVSVQAKEGYVIDDTGDLVRSESGECVRNGSWEPENAIEECHPGLIERVTIAPETQKVTNRIVLQTDTYFAFDSAELSDQGKSELNRIAQTILGAENPRVAIEAYADPIGTEQYNLELSQQRAQAVKEYLTAQGVPNSAIQAQGKGTTRSFAECADKKGRELVECLAPNRRAEVEFAAFEVTERQVGEPRVEERINQEVLEEATRSYWPEDPYSD